ncbi:MAG: hypothetical protein KJ566_03360 [Nanoarchaeota archaeon]|nr:hypothetical protein [Nanoarchaeota archaeon]
MMNKKRLRFFGFFTLIIGILILGFVLAAIVAPTDLIFNNNVTSDYDEGNFFVNWTAGGTDEVNYTIYISSNNTLYSSPKNNSVLGYSFSNTTEANYTFIIEAVNATGDLINSTTNISIYVDRTAPVITLPEYTNATLKKNTQQLTLNISVVDALSGETGSVCLIDVNGTSNQTVTVDSGWCNSTAINLTGSTDGNHTLSIYVNDTVNNLGLNNSYVVQVDTTAPTATASCTPSTLYVEEVVTCSCSGTDATSGVNSSLTTAGSTPSTSTAGTFTYSCSITDNTGNSASSTDSYTITNTGGGGTSTTSQWTNTQTITNQVFEQGYTKDLGEKNRIKFKVGSEDHHVGVVSITTDKATIEIASNPVQVILAVGEDAKVDVANDGFYDIYVLLNSIVNNKANVTIQKIHEEIPLAEEGPVTTTGEMGGEKVSNEPSEKKSFTWLWVLIAIILIGIIVWWFVVKKNKKH